MEVFRASGSAPANPHLLRAMAAMAKQDNESTAALITRRC